MFLKIRKKYSSKYQFKMEVQTLHKIQLKKYTVLHSLLLGKICLWTHESEVVIY